MDIQQVKLRFGIIGSAPGLLRALDIAVQVAPTDMSVLITGESGVGKEVFPQVIHQNSVRKHGAYFAVNCGAIPEGTVDSELFGHEKGSFTGAYDARKGYFEVADGGTLFLDEVAELPLFTQVRLLRVLETGEFLRVGSAKTQKTNVRVIAATNINLPQAIQNGKFREDLYYRLNTVPISVPPLRDRKDDIALLFRKFAADFAEKYKMPAVQLAPEARAVLESYPWPGNIRQLKNITEQISIIESERLVDANTLQLYLPEASLLPVVYRDAKSPASGASTADFSSEREILYKFLFDVKNDVNELKKLVNALMQGEPRRVGMPPVDTSYSDIPFTAPPASIIIPQHDVKKASSNNNSSDDGVLDTSALDDESLSINEKEIELMSKALEKHHGKRKFAARELGISERTLYRKIKDYGLMCALAITMTLASCTVKYSFSGASISPESKTFSVQFFPNMAPLVNPVLSSTFTEALTMKFLTGTRLSETDDVGDLAFEGEITGYAVTPQAITAGEVAAQNRLTISVHVKFTNAQDPAQSFDKSFSQYEDYDSQRNLSDVEGELVDAIVKKLIEDIFNAAVANW